VGADASEPTQVPAPRHGFLAGSTTTVALLSAIGAAVALGAELFLESPWTPLTCGDGYTLLLQRLLIASVACSALAVVDVAAMHVLR
jgi:hypothetical protein